MMLPLKELFSLDGRIALVTGASSGIGRLMAQTLAEGGAAVVLLGRDRTRLEEAAQEIIRGGGRASTLACDLGDRTQLDGAASEVTRPFGAPDILVNAAGVNYRPLVENITRAMWDETMRVNLDAPFFLAQHLAPAMRRKGWGRIINIASQQSIRAFNNSGSYGASKGGVTALTRGLAEAWSREGVTCNAIGPAYVPTAMAAAIFSDPDKEKHAASLTLIGRNSRLEDLRGITLFLASRASDYVTGQTIFVDGGMSVH
jgi:gluconate 5-dehydrogenase